MAENQTPENINKEYLLEVYKQGCEYSRLHTHSRFANLSAFLTYVSILIAALAFIFSSQPSILPARPIGVFISLLGMVISFFFLALDYRHHNYWEFYEEHVIKRLEKIMKIGLYPEEVTFSGKRDWIKKGLFGIGATQAVICIYIASIIFFSVITVTMIFYI